MIKACIYVFFFNNFICFYCSIENIQFLVQLQDMQDSIKEMLKKFEGSYKQFKITLKILHNQSLLINVVNLETLQAFELNIDQQYVDAKPDFTNIFESPVEIIEFVSTNFSQVKILQNGAIHFEFKFAGLKKKAKIINIETKKKEQDRLQVIDLRIQQLRENFQAKLDEKEHANLILQNRVATLEASNLQMKKDMQKLNKKIYNMLNFGCHPYNYDDKEYCEASLKGEGSILRISCLRADSIFINKQQIQPGQRIVYTLRVVNLQKSQLGIGMVTISSIAERLESEAMLLVFEEDREFIVVKQQQRKVKLGIKKGDIMTIEADLITNKITWRNNQISVSAELNEEMKNKSLLLFVGFKRQNDTLEILTDL